MNVTLLHSGPPQRRHALTVEDSKASEVSWPQNKALKKGVFKNFLLPLSSHKDGGVFEIREVTLKNPETAAFSLELAAAALLPLLCSHFHCQGY